MDEAERLIRTGYPLVRVTSLDEEAAAMAVREWCREVIGAEVVVYEWDAARGVQPATEGVEGLDQLLDLAADAPGPALYIIRDAHRFLDDPGTARRLRRLPSSIGARPVRVILLTPPGDIRDDLAHDLPSAAFALPTTASLVQIVENEVGLLLDESHPVLVVASALRGLTALEARLALRRSASEGVTGAGLLSRLFHEKARRIEGSTLEFFPPGGGIDEVGGLDGLKTWALRRGPAFIGRVRGLPAPRGILLTGVSGCGKSYGIKALSPVLGAPLFRLDMARVFAHREPEAAFARALSGAQAMAPCILWIDEIENAFALGAQDTGSAARITGSLLTWLQERPDGVFVAATANRIELLPAELLRRGRFDQIFFVDLPTEEERKSIWAIHLRANGAEPAHFDLIVLAASTPGWSGAEIAGVVQSATLESAEAGHPLAKADLFDAIGRTVPLSVTMEEQIKGVREWAYKRAISASSAKLR